MFKIIEGDFKNNKYSNEEYLDNWPMLYILENGKKAYIARIRRVQRRMGVPGRQDRSRGDTAGSAEAGNHGRTGYGSFGWRMDRDGGV